MSHNLLSLRKRFDGYLPVVIDLETTGVQAEKNGLLELGAVHIQILDGLYTIDTSWSARIAPFEGCVVDEAALAINKIQPYHPFRFAISEKEALQELFVFTQERLAQERCRRAVLVGHNAHFDLKFMQAAMKRCGISEGPYHPFTCFDTATLAGLVYGKTVLAKALKSAQIEFDSTQAHSAQYDALKTAELFCKILNLQSAHSSTHTVHTGKQ